MLYWQTHKYFIRLLALALMLIVAWPSITIAAPTKPCNPATSKVDCAAVSGNCSTAAKCDLISKYVNPVVNLLSAAVGLVLAISFILAGIQYSTASGEPQKVSAAKHRIANTVVALIAFVLLYAVLNFFLPGGLI